MPNRSFATALASALADLGVEHACISPGSRNAPLIAGFAAESRIRKWPLLDERSAGFFAIGMAKTTGAPVVLACTSGTAAAEYHPAVVEASQSDVPLIVLTADRPPELRGVGSPQTIDQLSLYGSAVRMFCDVPTPEASTDPGLAAAVATAAWSAATASPPGPVHLNLPFREPLLQSDTQLAGKQVTPIPGSKPEQFDAPEIANRLDGRLGLIVAGQSTDPDFGAACAKFGARAGFPILSDPLSGLRFGDHLLDNVLAYADQLAGADALDSLRPEVVVRFGPVPTSKPMWAWLQAHPEVDQILIDIQGRDATRSSATTLRIGPTDAATAIAAAISSPAPPGWLESWIDLDTLAAERVVAALENAQFPNEPMTAATVVEAAPAGSVLTVGSSMPIRDVDAFGGKSAKRLRVFGNRGANGIDGVLSAGLGTAAAGGNAIVLLGDVSLFHDLNALGTAVQLDLPITIIVVNNNGGGIFHFLPHHGPDILDPATFEAYLATPHGTDFVPLAAAFGIAAERIDDVAALERLVSAPATRPRLLQVDTNRHENLALHRSIAAEIQQLFR